MSSVVKFEPKGFRQQAPDGKWKVKGIRQVPYRLPDVIEAVSEGRLVVIVEGERDVDNLWKIGLAATCNAGGAGKWKDELNEHFTDADVVVLPDNDPQARNTKTGELRFHEDGRPILPGWDHAMDVCAKLQGVAARVRLLDLAKHWQGMPDKADVSDWLAAGHTREQLDELIARAPDWSPGLKPSGNKEPLPFINVGAWQGQPTPLQEWFVRDRVPHENVTLLNGDGATGKTTISLQLCIAGMLGNGRDWLGGIIEKNGPVVFFTAEESEKDLHRRLAAILPRYGADYSDIADKFFPLCLLDNDATLGALDKGDIIRPTPLFLRLQQAALDIRPVLIAIEAASDVFAGDEIKRGQVRSFLGMLRGQLAIKCETAVML